MPRKLSIGREKGLGMRLHLAVTRMSKSWDIVKQLIAVKARREAEAPEWWLVNLKQPSIPMEQHTYLRSARMLPPMPMETAVVGHASTPKPSTSEAGFWPCENSAKGTFISQDVTNNAWRF